MTCIDTPLWGPLWGSPRGDPNCIMKIRGNGGAEGNRTPDLVIANDALSQLSYGPETGYLGARVLVPARAPVKDGYGLAAGATGAPLSPPSDRPLKPALSCPG